MPGIVGSVLGLVGQVSVYCDLVRWQIWSATAVPSLKYSLHVTRTLINQETKTTSMCCQSAFPIYPNEAAVMMHMRYIRQQVSSIMQVLIVISPLFPFLHWRHLHPPPLIPPCPSLSWPEAECEPWREYLYVLHVVVMKKSNADWKNSWVWWSITWTFVCRATCIMCLQ